MKDSGDLSTNTANDQDALLVSPPESLAEKAHGALEELIVTMRLPPGSTWNEQSLADMVGVGRTPTREAIKRLETQHLIVIVPRHGVRISEIDLYRQMYVVELRGPLEELISSWASVRSSPQERQKLLGMARAFDVPARKRDPVAYLRNVFEANSYIALCARNMFAAQSIAPLHTLSRRFFYKYHDPGELSKFSMEHGARARAVASGDPAAATAATREMMRSIDVFTRTVIARNHSPA